MLSKISLSTKLDDKERFTLVVREILNYLEINNIPLNSIKTYQQIEDMKIHTQSGVSLNKSTFTSSKFTSWEIVKAINPNAKTKKEQTYAELLKFCNKVHLKVLEYGGGWTQTAKIKIKCLVCGAEDSLTVHSLLRRASPCKFCANKQSWKYKEEEFFELCSSLNIIPLYNSISEYQVFWESGRIPIECYKCGFKDSRSINYLIQQRKFECKKCSPRGVGCFGHITLVDEIIFDSKIESEVYIALRNKFGEDVIEIQPSYAILLGDPSILYIGDFKINNSIIEVTSFTRYHHQDYYIKMDKKKQLIEDKGYKFHLVNTLADVDALNV